MTLFCEKLPLREVMRQLSRPFGYTWLRSGKPGEYQYELAQDLKSQLLEEELRNRDRQRRAAGARSQDMSRYRPYLRLSPDEALAQCQDGRPGREGAAGAAGRDARGAHPDVLRASRRKSWRRCGPARS